VPRGRADPTAGRVFFAVTIQAFCAMIEFSPTDRRLAKDMAFCKACGGDPRQVMGLSEAEAARIIQAWGDRYSLVRDALRMPCNS